MGRQTRRQNRTVDVINPLKRFLIVSEGEETEPNYFEFFRVPGKIKVKCIGIGRNTIEVVREAIKLRDKDEYDYIWCVFDRDAGLSVPSEKFNMALNLARRNSIEVAYSNDSFEIWYLLHFNYYDSSMSRFECEKKLNKIFIRDFKRLYSKSDKDIYDLLIDKQEIAIFNAEKLLEKYFPHNPEANNPSTTVHLLVKQLNDNKRISDKLNNI